MVGRWVVVGDFGGGSMGGVMLPALQCTTGIGLFAVRQDVRHGGGKRRRLSRGP